MFPSLKRRLRQRCSQLFHRSSRCFELGVETLVEGVDALKVGQSSKISCSPPRRPASVAAVLVPERNHIVGDRALGPHAFKCPTHRVGKTVSIDPVSQARSRCRDKRTKRCPEHKIISSGRSGLIEKENAHRSCPRLKSRIGTPRIRRDHNRV